MLHAKVKKVLGVGIKGKHRNNQSANFGEIHARGAGEGRRENACLAFATASGINNTRTHSDGKGMHRRGTDRLGRGRHGLHLLMGHPYVA